MATYPPWRSLSAFNQSLGIFSMHCQQTVNKQNWCDLIGTVNVQLAGRGLTSRKISAMQAA